MTQLWRYKAVPLGGPNAGLVRAGELTGESAVGVRASLRQIGLQVIELREVRSTRTRPPHRSTSIRGGILSAAKAQAFGGIERHCRRRRQPIKAEFFDSLATMVRAGLPLLEALDSMAPPQDLNSGYRRVGMAFLGATNTRYRRLVADLRDQLRGGSSLGHALANHPMWFDPAEVAMVNAGQVAGTLPTVLMRLSQRHARSSELSGKLAGALAYPAVISIVGLGVVVFLSVKTLPDLTGILTNMGLTTPRLTAAVMSVGQFIAGAWLYLLIGLGLLPILLIAGRLMLARIVPAGKLASMFRAPAVVRRMVVARFCDQLAMLLGSGVPMTEALRVLPSTVGGSGSSFGKVIASIADRIERGEDFASSLDDSRWFDMAMRRLIEVGQVSGELESILNTLAERYLRQSMRLIDRLAALLEPAVILLLASLVGVVVLAAILPLIKLQEVL